MIDRKKVQNSLDHHVFSDNPFDENMKAEMIRGLRWRKNRESRPKKVPRVLKPLVSVFLLAVVAGCMFFYVLGSGQQNLMTSPADFTASLVHYKKVKSELGDVLLKKIAKQYATNPEIQNTPWKVSPSFAMRDKDGSLVWQDHDHIKGVKNKIAFINIPDLIHAKSQRDVAKRFWYVWGNPDSLIGKQLTAFAVHRNTGETFLLDQVKLSPSLYGEDASALTEWAAFPSKGMWRIDVFIGGNYFDSIVVNIKSAYIKTRKATFLLSRYGLKAGTAYHIRLDVNGNHKEKTIKVKTVYWKDSPYNNIFVFKKDATFTKTNGKKVTSYTGKLEFGRPGNWEINVLGDVVAVDVKK